MELLLLLRRLGSLSLLLRHSGSSSLLTIDAVSVSPVRPPNSEARPRRRRASSSSVRLHQDLSEAYRTALVKRVRDGGEALCDDQNHPVQMRDGLF
jgi:hypothetical protein